MVVLVSESTDWEDVRLEELAVPVCSWEEVLLLDSMTEELGVRVGGGLVCFRVWELEVDWKILVSPFIE